MESPSVSEVSSDHIVALGRNFLTNEEAVDRNPVNGLCIEDTQYWIRLANTEERKTMSSVLVTRMYSGKGYNVTPGDSDPRERASFTLLVQDANGETIGTLSVGLDSVHGLYADILYPEEVNLLRSKGAILCEFRKFAISPDVKNRRAIASVFHIALLYTRKFFGVTDCISEVTPEHSRFYRHFLEAEKIGGEKLCPRVNTVGVLMHLNMVHAEKRAIESGGQMNLAGDRSLYPYFFSPKDAEGILGRLMEIEGPALEEISRKFCP